MRLVDTKQSVVTDERVDELSAVDAEDLLHAVVVRQEDHQQLAGIRTEQLEFGRTLPPVES